MKPFSILIILLSIVLPIVKGADTAVPKAKEKIYPRLNAAIAPDGTSFVKLSGDNAPVLKTFVADLVILYAFDMGDHYEMVANRDLKDLGVNAEELHALAIHNLRALNLEIGARRGERIMMLTAGGEYEATLLLLPDIWKSVGGMVEGSVVIGIPAKDVLFVTGDAKAENITDLENSTVKSLAKVDKPLSRHLLKWNGSTWESIKLLGK